MVRHWALGGLLGTAATVLLAGCIHVKIEEDRQIAGSITSSDAIALVAKPQSGGVNAESEFLDCLERQLLGAAPPARGPVDATRPATVAGRDFRILPHRYFVDMMYPWLEPSTAVVDHDFANALLAHQGVRERIVNSGVRYVIAVDGSTNVTDKNGSITCAVGPGGGGCFGVAFWKKQSGYEASVWDMQRGVSLGTVGTDVSGNSVFIGALVPLPFIAPVQHTACTRLAGELQRFLTGGGT